MKNFKLNLIVYLGIGDWGLGIGDSAQSPIPNPQSPIPKSPFPMCYLLWIINLNNLVKFIFYYILNYPFNYTKE